MPQLAMAVGAMLGAMLGTAAAPMGTAPWAAGDG